MRDPNIILDILNKRSVYNITINKIYPLLYNQDIYLLAYKNLTNEYNLEIDNKVLKHIENITEEMRYERYNFKYVNCIKKGIKKLSVSEFKDKLVQEVLGIILRSIYEPKFLESSHGYRPNKGCNTALQRIQIYGQACEFFIRGKIKNIFSSIDSTILLNILKHDIKDNRFIELIRRFLKVLCKSPYDNLYSRNNKTYSGSFECNNLLLSVLVNIYLNEFDKFINKELRSIFHNNIKREESKEYRKLRGKIQNEEKKIRKSLHPKISRKESIERLKKWRKELRQTRFCENIYTTKSRRLTFTRYIDDWFITFTGTFEESKYILDRIKNFLKITLKLELKSDENFNIIKSDNQKNPARFLNYNVITQWSNTKITNSKRSMIGTIAFLIPDDIIKNEIKDFSYKNKPIHLAQCLTNPIFDIINYFQYQYSGICQYYKFARNQEKLAKLKWIMEQSLTKTLANKLKISVSKIYKRYKSTKIVDGYTYKVIQDVIVDENNKEHIAYFGAIPLKRQKFKNNSINDSYNSFFNSRNSLASKLINKKCDLCNSDENIEIHHINNLKNIDPNKSVFLKRMIAMKRKTIALCKRCHNSIHNGNYDGISLKLRK